MLKVACLVALLSTKGVPEDQTRWLAGKLTRLDEWVVAGLESGFGNQIARSRSDAFGVMQVTEIAVLDAARSGALCGLLGDWKNNLDQRANICWGRAYLSLLRQRGLVGPDLYLAYHSGAGALGNPGPEGRTYVSRALKLEKELKRCKN